LELGSGHGTYARSLTPSLAVGASQTPSPEVEAAHFLLLEEPTAFYTVMHQRSESEASDEGPEFHEESGEEIIHFQVFHGVQTQAQLCIEVRMSLCLRMSEYQLT